jgi:hypothetical protein
MNSTNKVTVEKRAVIGLAGLFMVTFILGPLKTLGGVFGGSSGATPKTPTADTVNVGKPLSVLIQQRREDTEPKPELEETIQAPAESRSPAVYAAGDLRDPLKSFLPEPDQPAQVGATQAESPVVETPPLPPPLTVQGLLWGGPEPKAIINGQLHGINDVIEGAKIVAIDRDGVTIEYHGASVSYSPSSQAGEGLGVRPPQQWR